MSKGIELNILGNISLINMGQSPDSTYYNEEGIGLPLIQGNADIKERKSIKRIWTSDLTKICDEGDILMTVRAPVGSIGLASFPSCIGRGVCSIKANGVDDRYLFYLLISQEENWQSFEQGSTFTAVGSKEVFNFPLKVIRSRTEQRRIARILSTTDAVIEKTQVAIVKYKAIKQGMLHDLFIRGIDMATGKLRPTYEEGPELYKKSKLGWVPREWEVDTLDKICEINPQANLPNNLKPKDEVSFFKMEDVSNDAEILNQNTRKVKDVLKKGFTPFIDNDILFAKITPCMENGKGALANNLKNAFGFGSTEFHVIRARDEKSIQFLFYLTTSNAFRLNAEGKMSGSAGQQRVPTSFFRDFQIAIPSIDEQFRIGLIIDGCNSKIKSEQTYLHKLQQIKRGLMEDLLSGRKRVAIQEEPAI